MHSGAEKLVYWAEKTGAVAGNLVLLVEKLVH